MKPKSQSEQKQSLNQSYARKLPVTQNEDVEFSSEQADAEDLEAVMRANAADQRQKQQ